MNPLNSLIIVIILTLGFEAQAALYRFIPEYPELSIDKPGMAGMDHFIDRSELVVFYDDEGIHYSGTFKMIWDIKKGGRVTMDAELEKFFRGGWQQTAFSVRVLGFCKEMKIIHSYIYEIRSRHVFPEDLQCLGKGIKYRHSAFTAKAHGQAFINMEGRYKVVTFFRAYDEHNSLRPEVICPEIPGDIIKI
uniref:Uncharacterized protein n=1 Tax=Glossina palpalis gambiensis TaxID=67801 RepID=A0A1B0C6C8_9MUSC